MLLAPSTSQPKFGVCVDAICTYLKRKYSQSQSSEVTSISNLSSIFIFTRLLTRCVCIVPNDFLNTQECSTISIFHSCQSCILCLRLFAKHLSLNSLQYCLSSTAFELAKQKTEEFHSLELKLKEPHRTFSQSQEIHFG